MSDACDVVVTGLGTAGEGVGRLDDGRVVFVRGALPGDRVRISVHKRGKRLDGRLERILEPSPNRVQSRCAEQRCGGCALKHLAWGEQHAHKRQRIVQTLRRIGGFDVDDLLGPIRSVGDGWRYRHRVRLHCRWHENRWQLGYYATQSHQLVHVDSCPVLWPELESAMRRLEEALVHLPREAGLTQVELAASRRDGRVAARMDVSGPLRSLRGDWTWFEASGLSGAHVVGASRSFRHGNLELRYDHAHADAFDLRYEPGLFTQSAPAMNDALVRAVLDAVKPRALPKVVEFHAGVGNFSVPLARSGAHVTAIESGRRAAVFCRANGRHSGLKIEVHPESDVQGAERAVGADVALLDPPRAGAQALVRRLAVAGPARVVYVSCDVATLARDLRHLAQGGYALRALTGFDLFPQTPHVECLAELERTL